MKTTLLGVLCLFISGWGSMQTALAQDLQEMEKSLSAINEELNQKTKEYSWQLVSAYADYCEANNKYISWNDVPYLQEIVEYNRPASLENYRFEHKVCKDALDKFLNTYKEYRELQHNSKNTPDMSDKQLECVNDLEDGTTWAEGWLCHPKLEHICMCHAVHSLVCHHAFSIPDMLRINDFWVEASIKVQHITDQTGKQWKDIDYDS